MRYLIDLQHRHVLKIVTFLVVGTLSNPVVQAMGGNTGNTGDARMQALGAASVGLNGYNTYNSLTDKAGNFDAGKAGGINLSISLGSSKSQSNTTSTSSTAHGSSVRAGGDVNITATGKGADSNLLIQGSSVSAGNNASLAADNKVSLLAAQNTAGQHSSNSGSIGLSVGSSGLGVTASANRGRGHADGQDISYTNTHLNAGNSVSIHSGGDTTLSGAVIAANTVKADVGGDLNIQSLQDTSQYASRQQSMGGSVTVGVGAGGSCPRVRDMRARSPFP